jgi:hypothetical protein
MVIYTCILRKTNNYYQCKKGNFDYTYLDLLDYKNISIPSSILKFPFFQQIEEFNLIKFSLPLQYQKSMKAHFEK